MLRGFMLKLATFSFLLALPGFALPEAVFEAQVIDDKITVGYGLAVADVDGDGKVDILLADSDRTVAPVVTGSASRAGRR